MSKGKGGGGRGGVGATKNLPAVMNPNRNLPMVIPAKPAEKGEDSLARLESVPIADRRRFADALSRMAQGAEFNMKAFEKDFGPILVATFGSERAKALMVGIDNRDVLGQDERATLLDLPRRVASAVSTDQLEKAISMGRAPGSPSLAASDATRMLRTAKTAKTKSAEYDRLSKQLTAAGVKNIVNRALGPLTQPHLTANEKSLQVGRIKQYLKTKSVSDFNEIENNAVRLYQTNRIRSK